MKDQKLKEGETYTIDFNLDQVSNLQGYQFTLAFDPNALHFENILLGELEGITKNSFGLEMLDEGIITSSWNVVDMIDTKNTRSFSIVFTAKSDAQLSELIHINSRYTPAQAYINDEFSDVSLAF